MAGRGASDKCIGKLTLDISDVQKKVETIENILGNLGKKNPNVKLSIAEEVKKQIDKIYQELENSSKEITNVAQKTINAINKIGETKVSKAQENSELKESVKHLQEYYNELQKAERARASGNMANYISHLKDADTALGKVTDQLRYQAQAYDSVQKAKSKLEETKNTTNQKLLEKENREIEKATQAYIKLLEAKSKVKQLETQGKQDTEEYVKTTQAAGKAYDAFLKYSKGARDAARATKEAAQARKDLNELESKVSEDTGKADYLAQIKQKYFELTDAIKNYNAAKKAGDDVGMATAQAKVDEAMREVSAIQEVVNASDMEATAKQQVLNYIQQCVTAEHQHSAEVSDVSNKTGELESQVKGLVTRYLSLMAVIRTISSLMNNMVEYVSEYSDKMNEIQMITMKTDAEVEALATTYRDLAAEMRVSSLDMADAAIYFTRQGLGAEEIEKRLKNVTMYAKAANVEFRDASEIITAVVNSMNLVEEEAEDGRNAAQRVADVFLNIGDNAATSGQEIGEAMQKAAASAGAFGVSMEWLAAYIATVSETTRQEARTIGTAFNTIIARLHQIKQTGYNQEDETKVNDIAKALSKIDVVLMDQEGNWRDMEVILQEVAKKWDGLDGKTKSYIATTMAGVKQQNVFLALMNDMSKGVENGSRAFELYGKAMNSNGVAADKYAIYLDSVTAAQERLTVAQENFYAILSRDVIKGWYNTLADLVGFITRATDAMGGLNIIIPLVAGGVTLLVIGIKNLALAIAEAGSASAWFATVWESHPVLLVITAVASAIVLLTTVAGGLSDATNNMKASFDSANKALEESKEHLTSLRKAQEDAAVMFDDFKGKANLTTEDLNKYNDTLEELAGISPVAKHVVDELKEGFITQEAAAEQLNAELERLVENEKQISNRNLIKRYTSYQAEDIRPQATSTLLDLLNDDFIQGVSGGDPQTAFKRALQSAYMSNALGKDLQEYIKGLADEYSKSMSDAQVWETIAGDMAYKLFGQFKVPDDITKNLVDQVNKEIEYVLSVVGEDMDVDELAALRASLINAIFGEDGELSNAEFGNFNNVIAQWVLEFASYGKDKIINEVSNIDIAETIAGALFDPSYFGELFQEQGDTFAKGFVKSYKQLLAEGFSDSEISDILTHTPMTAWDNAGKLFAERLKNSIKEQLGTDFLGQVIYSDDGAVMGKKSLMWDNLDLSSLKLINDMVQSGVIDLNQINSLMIESDGNVSKFAESLKNYGAEVGFVVEEIDDADSMFPKEKTIAEVMKGLKSTISEIKEMDSTIKKLKSDKAIDFDDMLDLVGAHPELAAVIHDTEAFTRALEELRDKTKSDAVGDVMGFITGSTEYMKNSKYAEFMTEEITNLNQYMATLDKESEQYKAIQDDLENVRQKIVEMTNTAEESGTTVDQIMKNLKEDIAEIKELDSVIKQMQAGGTVSYDKLLDLAGAHPELIAVIDDEEKLLELLEKIRDEAKLAAANNLREEWLGSSDFMENSAYAGFMSDRIKSMQDYISTLQEGSDEWVAANRYMDQQIEKMIELTNTQENETKTLKDLNTEVKEARQELDKLDTMIDNLASGKSIKFEDLLDLTMAHPEIVSVIGDSDALLAKLKEIREQSKETFGEKVGNLMWKDADWAAEAAKTQGFDLQEGETLEEYRTRLEQEGKSTESLVAFVNAAIDALKLAREELDASTESWLESQASQIEQQKELNYAKATGYEEQIHALQTALGESEQEALNVWNSFDAKMKESIADTYPGIISAMNRLNKEIDSGAENTESLNKATEDLNRELSKSEKFATAKHFTDTYSSIQKLENGTISATDAYEAFDKELKSVSKAYEDILDVQNKLAYNANPANKDKQQSITESDVSNLANVLNMTAEDILANFPAAVDMFNELTGSAGELETALNMLNDAAFIKITGTSDADFSAIEAGLIYVQNLADEAVKKLLDTGQWEVDTIQMNQTAALWNWDNEEKTAGHWSYPQTIVGAEVLKPTGNNPFKGQSKVVGKQTSNKSSGSKGSGGGGSSGHDTKKTETEVEHMLDLMSQMNSINQAQQNYYQAQQKYYSQNGKIQGVIAYMQKEKEELESQKPVIEDNIKEIERYMAIKKQEIASLSTDDEAYAEVADDLDKLQKAHQNYTKQLVETETAVDALTEAMEEQRKKVRQMEIDLRNTILQAIEDREKKKEDMLNAEIQMENKILDLIKKRYETERDEILRVTDQKIEALQQERDLLSEQLELRKKQEETEDKVAKLKSLEVKYQRIIADPTRAKEAQKLRTEIDDLRREMAWDAAEEEVKSQQESLDQQIDSLEDYKNYIEEFYEDLFEHPQALIEEMRSIIMGTQQSIIEWLKANDAEYKKSSENTQKSMVNGWKQTYDDMKGILKTYWEEVEFIISQGDDYIIEFLMNNSADYAAAGKLQAEAYVDEWKKQLSDLKKAHEQVVANIAAEYEAIAKSTYVAPSGGGGGRGGGTTEDHGYSFTYGGKEYKAGGFTSKEAADSAMRDAVYNILRVGAGTMASSSMIGQGIRAVQNAATVYAKGGIADFTGPAWLDGSPQDPERILSPYQTKLFESMVSALENIDRIMIPSMSNYSNLQTSSGNAVSVGDIVVNVDNLDTDDDYEEMASKVCEILMSRIGQTTAIGGLRIRSV